MDTQYKVIRHNNLEIFLNICNDLIANGWTPLGGVSPVDESSRGMNFVNVFYYQTFIKTQEK